MAYNEFLFKQQIRNLSGFHTPCIMIKKRSKVKYQAPLFHGIISPVPANILLFLPDSFPWFPVRIEQKRGCLPN